MAARRNGRNSRKFGDILPSECAKGKDPDAQLTVYCWDNLRRLAAPHQKIHHGILAMGCAEPAHSGPLLGKYSRNRRELLSKIPGSQGMNSGNEKKLQTS
jgi:hypothetical protein